jgi:hypothetical protein
VKLAYTVTIDTVDVPGGPSAGTAAAVYLDALRRHVESHLFRIQGDYDAYAVHVTHLPNDDRYPRCTDCGETVRNHVNECERHLDCEVLEIYCTNMHDARPLQHCPIN